MQNIPMLYPAIEPYAKHQLKADSHQIYVEECGNPEGLPVLYVHGGPGTGCNEDSRRYFDPALYRIVLFDQRGAGQSLPQASLEDNTTQHLIADMETIRHYLHIDRWILFGGSWGSTLSLVYAETFPDKVLALILRGIFLARQQDFDWLYSEQGLSQIFPDRWQVFRSPLPSTGKQETLLQAYYALLHSQDSAQQLQAAKCWTAWETGALTVQPRQDITHRYLEDALALSFARIECHYMIHHCFLKPDQILQAIKKIQNIPGIIVHGRYDVICPLENAWSLHQAWPKAELNIIPAAGHSTSEPAISEALLKATQKIATEFNSFRHATH